MSPARAAIVLGFVLGGCARPSGAPAPPSPGAARCLVIAGADAPTSRVAVALADTVDSYNAPLARNDGERVVFAGLYETLVRLDCEGNPIAGLAGSWESSDGGRRWTFTLRPGAAFWDGAPVTARHVAEGKSGAGFTLTPAGEHTVIVMLARGTRDVPRFLADPALAVTKPAPDRGWPIGSGRFWVTRSSAAADSVQAQSLEGDTIVFQLPVEHDERPPVEERADLAVMRDSVAAAALAARSGWSLVPLPPDRVYVLATPPGSSLEAEGFERIGGAGPFWWNELAGCGLSPQAVPPREGTAPAPPSRRTVFPRANAMARALAVRVARPTRGTAAGLRPGEWASAFAAGTEAGYVFPLPRRVADPCRAAMNLLPRWGGTGAARIAPIGETRAWAVARRGAGALGWVVDWDGTLRLAPR